MWLLDLHVHESVAVATPCVPTTILFRPSSPGWPVCGRGLLPLDAARIYGRSLCEEAAARRSS